MPQNHIDAVLVKLSISIPGNTEDDEILTAEVKRQQEMTGDVGGWKSNRLPSEAMSPLNSAVGAIRKRGYKLTLPWLTGLRILPTRSHDRYVRDIEQEGPVQFEAAKQAWLSAYPGWVEQMRINKNGNFRPEEYPPAAELADMFHFAVHYQPFPQSNHFVATLMEGTRAEMQEQFERHTDLRIRAAVGDVWRQLLEPVRKMAQTLAEPEKGFHQTLLGNIRDILDRVPLLNVTNNAELTQAAGEIRALTQVDIEDLKKNPVIRAEYATRANELATRFGELGIRRMAA